MYKVLERYENDIKGKRSLPIKMNTINQFMNGSQTIRYFDVLINFHMIKLMQECYKKDTVSDKAKEILKKHNINDENEFIARACGWSVKKK